MFYPKQINYLTTDIGNINDHFFINAMTDKMLLETYVNYNKLDDRRITTCLSRNKDVIVPDKLCLEKDKPTCLFQVSEWLSYVSGQYVSIAEVYTDKFIFAINNVTFDINTLPLNYKQALEIILATLLAKIEDFSLVIEYPENYLHPRAQSRLTNFLVVAASSGLKVYIQSYSEYILNALRIAMIDPDVALTNTDIGIWYLTEGDIQPTEIPVDKEGGIKVWKDGFFDEIRRQFRILFKL